MSSDGPSIPTTSIAVNAVPMTNHDSSFDMDLSLPGESGKRSKQPPTKSKSTEKFVPAKGQRTAAARLNKIKRKYQHLHDTFNEMCWI